MIKGQKVYLKLIEKQEINRLYDICTDKDVCQFNDVSYDTKEKSYFIRNFNKIIRICNNILSIINEKNVLVGFINYESKDKNEGLYNIGIIIGKEFWGRGYGKDSIMTLAKYLFKEKDARELELQVAIKNERAIKCYNSCGFIKGDINKKNIKKDTSCFDIMKMHLYKENFYEEEIS